MLPVHTSDIPQLTTIVSLFILVYAVEHHESTCLCDLHRTIGDKPWQITKDGNFSLNKVHTVCNKDAAGEAKQRGVDVWSGHHRHTLWMFTLWAKGEERFS